MILWANRFLLWIVNVTKQIFLDLFELLGDLVFLIIRTASELGIYILGLLNVPALLRTYQWDAVIIGFNPGVLYFMNVTGIWLCLAIVGAAIVSRISLKVLTLGKW